MDPETQKQLLDIIATHGDDWWNDDEMSNAEMVVAELNEFCNDAGVVLTLTK
jgi:hypothetical protein